MALRRAPVRVTVVDRTNHHLFQPLLYQVAMAGLSPADIAAPIRSVLRGHVNVSVILSEAKEIDLQKRELATSCGTLAYDWLIVAAGAENDYFGHDDWAERAPGLKRIEDALEIRRRVLMAFELAEEKRIIGHAPEPADLTFVVIGGGPTGVELAGSIAELSRFALARDFRAIDPLRTRVVLIEGGPRVLAAFPESLSQKGFEQLADLGVEVKTGQRVQKIDERGVMLASGERIDASVVLWGAGVRASPLAGALVGAAKRADPNTTLELDRAGRVPVRSDCSIVGHPEVFVIGDMAAFHDASGATLPGLSPVALQQGRFVSRLIRRRAAKKPEPSEPDRFHYVDKGTMATIGRSRAVAWSGPLKVSGFLAWMMWLVVHLWFLITFRNRVAVLFNWAWSYFTYKRGARLITEVHAPALPPANVSVARSPA
jgi:NADH dehydrogenase